MGLTIAELPLAGGLMGLCPLPGRDGKYAGDLATVQGWRPDLVLSLTAEREAQRNGAPDLARDLAKSGIAHRCYPIADFGTPGREARALWPEVSSELHKALAGQGRVLIHCLGGCGRSGMIALRLMLEAGEEPEPALLRLRAVRPCAVETKAQMRWAVGG